MSTSVGLQIGKAIYNILSNDTGGVLSITGMAVNKIQPAPLIREGDTNIGVVYEISAVNPVNVKRPDYRIVTAPLYNVTFQIECMHTVYHDSIILAERVCTVLQESAVDTYNTIKLGGINLDTMTETYNKERRYYSKILTFDARVLL